LNASVRLFIGMPVPPHAALHDVTAKLTQRIPTARRVPDGSWHVTLRFLGDIDDPEPVITALREGLVAVYACPGRIVGVGAFPKKAHAAILWAGVNAPGIDTVARHVVESTAHIGEKPDERAFVPHLTLARLRAPRDVTADVADLAAVDLGPAPLDQVVLFQSRPGPAGPRYTAVQRFALDLPRTG
jgi:2'-5' RNA ligase